MKFYRYEDVNYYEGQVRICERIYYLVRETPCGHWISIHPNNERKRWVNKTARKRFAYPTKWEAMVSFVARKRSQVGIYQARLEQAENAWRQGRNELEKLDGRPDRINASTKALRLY